MTGQALCCVTPNAFTMLPGTIVVIAQKNRSIDNNHSDDTRTRRTPMLHSQTSLRAFQFETRYRESRFDIHREVPALQGIGSAGGGG